MYDDENEEDIIYKTDKDEELQKENNPYYQEFLKVLGSFDNINCLINVAISALNNEFEEVDKDDMIIYTELISEHLQNHKKILKEFFENLDLPNGKAKLFSLSTYIRPEK